MWDSRRTVLFITAAVAVSCTIGLTLGTDDGSVLLGSAPVEVTARRCSRPCPPGQQCLLKRFCFSSHCFGRARAVCVPLAPPVAPTCREVRCGHLQTCVLHQVTCVAPPCHPQPVCIQDGCATVRCGHAVCRMEFNPNSSSTCKPHPGCRYKPSCVPLAKPKPGFCPAASQVTPAGGSGCELDNNCPHDLLCCRDSNGGRSCTPPASPDPCTTITCPPAPNIIGATCVVRDGKPSCADRVCLPGSYFCRDGKQCYCSDGGEIICTNWVCQS